MMGIPKQGDLVKKKWPWWLWPIAPYGGRKKLLRCRCGRVMWDRGMPQYLRRLHSGHSMDMCMEGTKWEFIKMKLGLLNMMTWNDFIQLLEGRFAR